jgi:hypothetical protein
MLRALTISSPGTSVLPIGAEPGDSVTARFWPMIAQQGRPAEQVSIDLDQRPRPVARGWEPVRYRHEPLRGR